MKLTVRALRLWFRVASRIAPDLAERHAAALFLTPRKRRTERRPEISGTAGSALTLEVGGLRLAGWSWGDGPGVLLLHGWGGCASDMAPLGGGLLRAGFRVVIFDMPAHGRSAGRRTSLPEWLCAMSGIERTLGTFDAVVGHSFGATAAALALEEGFHARGAVLLAPPAGPAYFVERARSFLGLPEDRVSGMLRRVTERAGRDIAFFDASRAARALTMPALILHDPHDPEVPWGQGAAIADAWAGSRLLPRDGLGHYRILDDPHTIAAVVDFIEGLPRR